MVMEPVLIVDGAAKSYGGKPALSDISLEVNSGEMFGVIGPDGAGKTTLFRIMATLLVPEKGSVTVCGYDTVKDYKEIRKFIGYMPGRFSLYQDLSVEENLNFFATLFGIRVRDNYDTIKHIYSQIEPFRKRRAGALSGGMKQKLALCCALIHKPKILLLDEPTTGVDPVSRKEFWDILSGLRKEGMTIIASTPIMDEALKFDRVAFVFEGTVRGVGKPKDIIEEFKHILSPDRIERETVRFGEKKAIVVENLTKKFGDFTAVDSISFQVSRGEIFGFLGANGAGKTTAMRMLCGLSKPTSGNAQVAGFDVRTQPEMIKKHIGYMSQKFSLYNDLSVADNIRLFAGIYGVSEELIPQKIDEMLEKTGLVHERDTMVSSLPLGWKQRLAFSVSIVHDPEIVFLDEPTGGVDPATRKQFWELIYDASKRGITIFVTTHYMDEAEYCDRISMMVDGKIEALDTVSNLKKKYEAKDMDEVFRKLARHAQRSE